MGWNIDLISDKNITDYEVEKIVSELPPEYKGHPYGRVSRAGDG